MICSSFPKAEHMLRQMIHLQKLELTLQYLAQRQPDVKPVLLSGAELIKIVLEMGAKRKIYQR